MNVIQNRIEREYLLTKIGNCETQFAHRIYVQNSHINAIHICTALNRNSTYGAKIQHLSTGGFESTQL